MVTKKVKTSVLKIQLFAILVSFFSSYIFGKLANSIVNNGLACGGDICGSTYIYIFGFYFGLIFCLSFAHFAFIDWSRKYYYLIMLPLLAFGLTDSQLLKLVVGFWLTGIITGMVASKLIPKKRPKY